MENTEELTENSSSAEIARNAKGDYSLKVKSYGGSTLKAVEKAVEGQKKLEEEIALHQAR